MPYIAHAYCSPSYVPPTFIGGSAGSAPLSPLLSGQVIYATSSELIQREGSVQVLQASDINNTGAIDQGRVSQALFDASILIDSYLQSRYHLPLSVKPPVLSLHCCALAIYLMTVRPTDQLQKRYDATIAWLTKIATGTFQLGIDAAGNEPVSESGAVAFTPNRRVFTQDGLRDYNNFGRRRW
jgi:phage gp36-like protein